MDLMGIGFILEYANAAKSSTMSSHVKTEQCKKFCNSLKYSSHLQPAKITANFVLKG